MRKITSLISPHSLKVFTVFALTLFGCAEGPSPVGEQARLAAPMIEMQVIETTASTAKIAITSLGVTHLRLQLDNNRQLNQMLSVNPIDVTVWEFAALNPETTYVATAEVMDLSATPTIDYVHFTTAPSPRTDVGAHTAPEGMRNDIPIVPLEHL